MANRFNYTGRQKIKREHCMFLLQRSETGFYFDADLKLQGYELDPQARVYVEAYRRAGALWKRISFGSIGQMTIPPATERTLSEFGNDENILFRVKVTAESDGNARLLAHADQISPLKPDDVDANRKSLLGTRLEDLKGEIWRLDFSGGRPELLVDNKVPMGTNYAVDPVFRMLAGPSILRAILNEILITNDGERDDDDPEDWRHQWIEFVERLPGIEKCWEADSQVAEEDKQDWIDKAVQSFSRQHEFLQKLIEDQNKSEGKS